MSSGSAGVTSSSPATAQRSSAQATNQLDRLRPSGEETSEDATDRLRAAISAWCRPAVLERELEARRATLATL